MTLERPEFRCPTCGHIIGEEENRKACNQFNKKAPNMYNRPEEEQVKRHEQEFDTAIKQEAQSKMDIAHRKQQDELRNERAVIVEKYEQEPQKNEELKLGIESDLIEASRV